MVPGAGDVPGSNPESREPGDVQQPAGVPGSRSEGVFSLDGAGEGSPEVPRNQEKGRHESEAPLEASIHEAARKLTFTVLRTALHTCGKYTCSPHTSQPG